MEFNLQSAKALSLSLFFLAVLATAATTKKDSIQIPQSMGHLKGDTVVLKYGSGFKYVEIGHKTYEIGSPTLVEAKPVSNWIMNGAGYIHTPGIRIDND